MSEDKELEQHMSNLMNPRVRDIEVGIRTLRKIKLFPLSITDQISLSDSIAQGFQIYLEGNTDDKFTAEAGAKLVKLVQTKLPAILKLVFPDEDPKKLLKEMDNNQLATIAEQVFRDNYENPAKKLASLFRPKVEEKESPLERLTQLSADTTPDTGSNISPDSATGKVESHKVN